MKDALLFPLHQWSRSIGLAAVYGLLLYSVPYLAVADSGALFAVLGAVPVLLANSLMLGIDLRVIDAVENGRYYGKNILDTSEMIADLGETILLGSAILVVTMGPYFLSILYAPEVSALAWLTAGWMVLYFPFALTVAASTNSFWEIINPANGIRAVQSGRSAYRTFYCFYLFICMASGGFVFTVSAKVLRSTSGSSILVLLPISIVLMAVLGSVIFYSNLVIAYLLGRVRFKLR